MKSILFATLVLASMSAHANDSLTPWTVALEVMDWAQTLQIEKHPELAEGNTILGRNPTRATVNLYFVSKVGLTMYLDNRYFNAAQIALSATAIYGNYQLGLKIQF